MPDRNSDAGTAEKDEDTEHGGEAYEIERFVTREEGAAALRRLANGVANGSVELGDEVTVAVPEGFELEIEYEQEAEEAELDAELEWPIVDGESVSTEGEFDSRGDDDGGATERDEAEEFGPEEDVAAEAGADRPIDEVIEGEDAASNARFELYRDRADEWRWRLVHANGNIIADSGEGYDRKAMARNGLESVMRNAPGATIVEVSVE